MLQAEIKGKLSKKIEVREDVLTSNVFSFFDYTDRNAFLRPYLRTIGINVSIEEAESAEFVYWPRFTDGTEPDVVLLVGTFYILVEAKYYSDFGISPDPDKNQINRELDAGSAEAHNLGRTFVFVAITADYVEPKDKFVIKGNPHQITWTNWQSVTAFLERRLKENIPQKRYAEDMYQLLKGKSLRSFLGFNVLNQIHTRDSGPIIFFDSASSLYRGRFIGFSTSFEKIPDLHSPPPVLYWGK